MNEILSCVVNIFYLSLNESVKIVALNEHEFLRIFEKSCKSEVEILKEIYFGVLC